MAKLKFGAEELSESARENFFGLIDEAEYPCVPDDDPDRKPSLHFVITPLSVYDKQQHEWVTPSKTKISKWGAFNMALDELGVTKKIKGPDSFQGMAFEFESREVTVGFGDNKAACWIPVRVIGKKELDKLIETAGEMEPDDDDFDDDDFTDDDD